MWYRHIVAEFFSATHSPTPDCAIWWTEEEERGEPERGSLAPPPPPPPEEKEEEGEAEAEGGLEEEEETAGCRGWTRKLFCKLEGKSNAELVQNCR